MQAQLPAIRVDFNNADSSGRVRLNTVAALADLQALAQPLTEGAQVRLVDDELSVVGAATFSTAEDVWTAIVDWDEVAAKVDN
jgi:hypothetical protein